MNVVFIEEVAGEDQPAPALDGVLSKVRELLCRFQAGSSKLVQPIRLRSGT
jgi:hypothetical protein